LEVDTAILGFSASLTSKGLPDVITSSQDLDRLMTALHEEIKTLHLWQYYVLNVTRERESVKAALKQNNNNNGWDGPDVEGKTVVELAQILRNLGKIQGYGRFAGRFGVYVEGEISAAFVKAAFVNVKDVDSLADAWTRVVDVLNVPLYEEWEGDIKAILENVRNSVTYTRLDQNGPKLGRISTESVFFKKKSNLFFLKKKNWQGSVGGALLHSFISDTQLGSICVLPRQQWVDLECQSA
jgi:glycogen debranching enzyme